MNTTTSGSRSGALVGLASALLLALGCSTRPPVAPVLDVGPLPDGGAHDATSVRVDVGVSDAGLADAGFSDTALSDTGLADAGLDGGSDHDGGVDASVAAGDCAGASNAFSLTGDTGDWVSAGMTYVGDPSAPWSGSVAYSTLLRFSAQATDGSAWYFDFRSADDVTQLTPGTYLDAQRASFRTLGHPGLDVGGDGRGCNMVTGSFVVQEVTLVGTDLRRFRASFEQHCEGGTTRAVGCIAFTAP